MKYISIPVLLICILLTCCDKDTVETPVMHYEYSIIAGDTDTIENNYYDYEPDFELTSDFSLGNHMLDSSLDIDFDSIYDLYFTNNCGAVNYYHEYDGYILVRYFETNVEVLNSRLLRISGPFDNGDTIDKEADWKTSFELAVCDDLSGCGFSDWIPNDDQYEYMGLCFFKTNDTLYGWLRLIPSVVVYDAAINKLK